MFYKSFFYSFCQHVISELKWGLSIKILYWNHCVIFKYDFDDFSSGFQKASVFLWSKGNQRGEKIILSKSGEGFWIVRFEFFWYREYKSNLSSDFYRILQGMIWDPQWNIIFITTLSLLIYNGIFQKNVQTVNWLKENSAKEMFFSLYLSNISFDLNTDRTTKHQTKLFL